MSQQELAEAIGVAQTNVSQWECGGSHPKPRNLRKLSMVLGKPVSYFIPEVAELAQQAGRIIEAPAADSSAMLPLIATVPMGDPVEAVEITDEFVRVTPAEASLSDFAFRVVGNSMWPFFWDGDMVGVRFAEKAEDRQIVIARLASGESTLKMYRQDPTSQEAWLEPLNKSLPKVRDDFAVRGIIVWIRKSLPGGKLPNTI
jgi:repressor LexA